jgi:predicted GIY-YIG superfamily endonuclease
MNKLTWNNIQGQSNEILSDGLFKLISQSYNDYTNITANNYGNYLISLNEVPFYIGEAKELSKRIKQQSKTSTSTFFKNFEKLSKSNQFLLPIAIDKFKVQFISNSIGRKEIEEFGIVNLPTILNNFQLDKRIKFAIADNKGLWDTVQKKHLALLIEGENKIFEEVFVPWFDLEIISTAGLYLVKDETDKFIYIGESSNIGERIKTHSGRTYFSALRRHIGTEILSFKLQEIKGRKRYFSETEDKKVTDFLSTCKATIFPVNFGRYELEEYLIKKYKPLLNRKDNKD